MIFHDILAWLAGLVISVIDSTGELGVFVLMAVESANIPVPSEVIMPFAGFVVSQGFMSFWVVVLVGALGNLVGSVVSYWVGLRGGRPFIEKYGKYFFVSPNDLERGDHYFKKYGNKVAFWSRLLPVVRTFISLPAGINRAPLASFSLFTFIGSFLWSALLTWIGFFLGERWEHIGPYFEKVSFLILGLIILVIILWIWHHIKDRRSVVGNQ